MIEKSQNPSDEKQDSPLPAINEGPDFYGRMVIVGALICGIEVAKALFTHSYGNYRRHAKEPTVWRWLASDVRSGAKKSASAIKNWNPDPDSWE